MDDPPSKPLRQAVPLAIGRVLAEVCLALLAVWLLLLLL
jgi:hypothetical protein